MGTLQVAEPLPDESRRGSRLRPAPSRAGAAAGSAGIPSSVHRAGARFPDLAKLFVERNGLLDEIAGVLAAYVDRGAIEGDLEMRAEQFFILVVGIPRRLAMLVGREPPAEEERRLRAAVRLFLDGCRAD